MTPLNRYYFLSFFLLAALFSGCSATEIAIGGDQTRATLLDQNVKEFNRALYWGTVTDALKLVSADQRHEFIEDFRKRGRGEKIIDIQVEVIDFSEDKPVALVDIITRYYSSPDYVVMEKRERQEWQYYRFDGGWQFHSMTQIDMPKVAEVRGAWGRL
ncbi:MAG: hypothetical protein PHC51_01745 [bacterium]|nr:hypothetical protein [bacterium]